MTEEFVVFDAGGNEVDWIDPYEGHYEYKPGVLHVSNFVYEYLVRVPEGGRYEIREMEKNE